MPRPDEDWPAEVAHLPICPKRGLPIPYIAEIAPDGTGNFTILDDQRTTECLQHRLCAVCGRPMGEEVALIGDVVSLEPDGFFIEPPVHERCGEIAAVDGPHGRGLCTFMAGERVPRRPHGDDVALVGMTPDELTAIGRTVTKRDWIMAITHDYRPALAPSHVGSPVMIYQAGRIIRVRRFTYTDGRLAPSAAPHHPRRETAMNGTGDHAAAARERRGQARDAALRRADIERRHEHRPGGGPGRTNSLAYCAEDNQAWPCDAIWLLGHLRMHEASCPAEPPRPATLAKDSQPVKHEHQRDGQTLRHSHRDGGTEHGYFGHPEDWPQIPAGPGEYKRLDAEPEFEVVDNITGRPVRGGLTEDGAAHLCRGLNLRDGPGGRYGTRPQTGDTS